MCTTDNIYATHGLEMTLQIAEIIHYGEIFLVNTFTEITTNVHSEVLQMFL